MSSTTPRNQTRKKTFFERIGIRLPSRFNRNQTVKVTTPRVTSPQTIKETELADLKTLQEAGPEKVIDAFNFDIERLRVEGESSEQFIKKLQKEVNSVDKQITMKENRNIKTHLQAKRRDLIKTIQDTYKLINQTKALQERERLAASRLERTQALNNIAERQATRKLQKALTEQATYESRSRSRSRTQKKGGTRKRRKYKKRH
jgi:hypothetical protein